MKTLLLVALLAFSALAVAPVAAAHEYVCVPPTHPAVASGCREVTNVWPDCWVYVGLDPAGYCYW